MIERRSLLRVYRELPRQLQIGIVIYGAGLVCGVFLTFWSLGAI